MMLLEIDPETGGVFETSLQPSKVIGVGLNYVSHITEVGAQRPKEPVIFLKPSTSLVQSGGQVVLPKGVGRVDYEGEIAVVVGYRARNVAPKDALKYIYGYGAIIDVTARDLQRMAMGAGMPWSISKGYDTFAPISPIVRREFVGEPGELEVKLWLNGELRQHGRASDMIFGFSALLSYISRVMTLLPGDVIATGTPRGVGPLSPGDRVKAEIPGLTYVEVTVAEG